MEPMNDNEELERDAPYLASLSKADPFIVPVGFFDRFPHRVQAAITAQQPDAVTVWAWWKRLSIALPIVALISLGAWMLTRRSGPVGLPVAVAVTPLTDGELGAMDDTEILAAFDEADAQGITAEDFGAVALALSDDELLAYLDNEDTDINDLIAEIE